MSNKNPMLAILRRCQAAIQGEIDLLATWIADPDTTSGRKSDCRRSRRFLEQGETAPLVLTQRILERADSLAEEKIVAGPKPESAAIVKHSEDDLKTRQEWPGPTLTQPWFEIALSRAEDNAQHAADCAAAIYAECT